MRWPSERGRAGLRRPDRRTRDLLTGGATPPGCSTSWTAASTTSWSTRPRTPRPTSGRSCRALTAEFFAGEASSDARLRRTVFAVGDEKQSIYSFQGAQPERLLAEARRYIGLAAEVDHPLRTPALIASWRSAPQVLKFVDAVFNEPAAKAGVRPLPPGDAPATEQAAIEHTTMRGDAPGSVELWPLIPEPTVEDADPWRPLDVEAPGSGRKQLADRIAEAIKASVERAEAVGAKGGGQRPAGYGDFWCWCSGATRRSRRSSGPAS
jgi:ATP-dependent helicase/nuclease subunit A